MKGDRTSAWRLESNADGDTAWLDVQLGDGWQVSYKLGVERGHVIFTEALVSSVGARVPSGGIDSTTLRGIPVGAHRSLLAKHTANLREQFGIGGEAIFGRHWAETVGPEKRKRARRDDTWYAQLAQLYVVLVDSGITRPIPIIADRLGLSPSTVTAAIRDARRMRMLTKAPGRRAGGRLTERALQILEKGEPNDG